MMGTTLELAHPFQTSSPHLWEANKPTYTANLQAVGDRLTASSATLPDAALLYVNTYEKKKTRELDHPCPALASRSPE
ncbi:hypothetical protein AVEN_214285-1 [Araneus ventricosus]|uniref:Uncharacterized protein n=1 Tax=Araneus ventricosus TaxID=182803 RepID=A0A4Y2KVX9_ARAVE|nr:hypothetical protein AVEN_214285-1 [Araneus ventricosus]